MTTAPTMQRRNVSPADASLVSGLRRETLRVLVHRGHISAQVNGCYDLNEIAAWIERRDQHQAKVAENRYATPTAHRSSSE